jgi:hypothetical protein
MDTRYRLRVNGRVAGATDMLPLLPWETCNTRDSCCLEALFPGCQVWTTVAEFNGGDWQTALFDAIALLRSSEGTARRCAA